MSGITLGIFILLMIAMVADRVFFQNTEKPKERPYVVFRQFAWTEPLAVGKVPTIEYEIENISTTQEVQLDMWGFTSSYIDYPEPGVGLPYPHPLVSGAAPVATPTPRSSEIIYYRPEKHKRVKMLPTQKLVERITLDTGLTAEQIAALNEGRDKARLFVYNRGKYTDEQGTSYDFTSCHEYDVVSFPRLIRCDDSVTIKDLP